MGPQDPANAEEDLQEMFIRKPHNREETPVERRLRTPVGAPARVYFFETVRGDVRRLGKLMFTRANPLPTARAGFAVFRCAETWQESVLSLAEISA